MISISEGQCGMCKHFGEHSPKNAELLRIRTSRSAPETFTDECGHPSLNPLKLKVTAASGCKGFEKAAES